MHDKQKGRECNTMLNIHNMKRNDVVKLKKIKV